MESAPPTILHQNDHEAEDLDATDETEKQAKDDNLAWAEGQYPSPRTFLTNPVSLPVENADSFESEGVDRSHENSFAFAATAEERPEPCSPEPDNYRE